MTYFIFMNRYGPNTVSYTNVTNIKLIKDMNTIRIDIKQSVTNLIWNKGRQYYLIKYNTYQEALLEYNKIVVRFKDNLFGGRYNVED